MPRYRVLSPGFFDDVYRTPSRPNGGVLNTDKILKPVPSWLEKISEETATQKKTRLAAEKKEGQANKDKAEQDKVDIDSVTFLESEPGSTVETL